MVDIWKYPQEELHSLPFPKQLDERNRSVARNLFRIR